VKPAQPPRHWQAAPPARPGLPPGAAATLILALVLAAYWPVLSAGFIWDDNGHLTRPDLQSAAGLVRIWTEIGATQQYYPLLHSAFWLEHQLWGDAPAGYHFANLLWHSGAAFLLGLYLRRLAVPGAWFTAMLFALHPVCVESVAWVSEQKNTLSLLLALAAANLHLTYDRARRPAVYAAATAVFIAALLAKTVTATLPAALLVVLWWRRGRLEWKRDIAPLVPWLVLGATAGLLTAWFERAIIGADGADFALAPAERLLLIPRALLFYPGKLLWPHPLVFIYPRWRIDAADWAQYLPPAVVLAGFAALVFLAFRRRRHAPLAVALIYTGTLLPAAGIVDVYPFIYSYVADHFQYHAATALIAGIAAVLAMAARRTVCSRASAAIAAAAFLLALGVLTSRQSHAYRDVFALYETTLARNPGAWMAHTNLGIALVDAGRPAEALPHHREALRLRPDYAEGENNTGHTLSALGRHAEALPHLRRAVALKPGYLQARNNLAGTLMALGRADEGLQTFRDILRDHPRDSGACFNLALALARSGRAAEALPHFEQAVQTAPDNSKYILHLGTALMFSGRHAEAEAQYRRALELDPDSATARYTYGRALLNQRRAADAAVQLREAVRLDDTFAEAHQALAEALNALGRVQEAQYHIRAARRLRAPTGR
jgi:Flp pilus assembly protein TadD